jgi:membrane-bound acyltransferase YfiQ involved in biofilm formation
VSEDLFLLVEIYFFELYKSKDKNYGLAFNIQSANIATITICHHFKNSLKHAPIYHIRNYTNYSF